MSLKVKIQKQLNTFPLRIGLDMGEEVVGFFGASGSGKSMTLKTVAGIESPDSGFVEIDGVRRYDSDRRINVPVHKRNIGLLFQNYALFPNMTLKQNIACGIHAQTKRVDQLIRLFHLEDLAHRYPKQLSGGQQQRGALARMLANNPDLILLDEPFSALDQHLVHGMKAEFMKILRNYGKSVIYVSHNLDELFTFCDKVAILQEGRIVEWNTPDGLIQAPQKLETAKLIGMHNYYPLRHNSPLFSAVSRRLSEKVGERKHLWIGIFPQDIIATANEPDAIRTKVIQCIRRKSDYQIVTESQQGDLFTLFLDDAHREGDLLSLRIPPDKLHILEE